MTLTPADTDRIIEMAPDRTPFEAIQAQFGTTESNVIRPMRQHLKPASFRRWRKRVNSGVSQKTLRHRDPNMIRFKCSRQRAISGNKISKR